MDDDLMKITLEPLKQKDNFKRIIQSLSILNAIAIIFLVMDSIIDLSPLIGNIFGILMTIAIAFDFFIVFLRSGLLNRSNGTGMKINMADYGFSRLEQERKILP